MTETTEQTYQPDPHQYDDNRIARIQEYANEHGLALALPARSKGLHVIGYPLAGYQQSKILDRAADTLTELINERKE